MNGFLHSLSDTQPAQALVAPLAPRLWRSDLAQASLDRATRLGARYEVVLGNLWGYPREGWRGRGPPWADLGAWRRFVRSTARAHRDKPVMWDVWNEPDVKEFWVGGRKRFLRTYAVAARVLRAELGERAMIGGPSISRYSLAYLRAFLENCRRERCPVSFLSWHENLQTGRIDRGGRGPPRRGSPDAAGRSPPRAPRAAGDPGERVRGRGGSLPAR